MASKHDYHWTFGDGCHIQFLNGADPISMSNHVFATKEGCATISDKNGGMILYTDGRKLYNFNDINMPTVPPTLGGNVTSCHSAIIVPPVAGGSRYHIFAVDCWEPSQANAKPVFHTGVTVQPDIVVNQPAPLPPSTGPIVAAERLAGVQHKNCDYYWVIALYEDAAYGVFHSILVDSDAPPTTVQLSPYPSGWAAAYEFCMKLSQDGTLLALAAEQTIDIFNFDRSTGAITGHSQVTGFTKKTRAYGVEFSPNGLYLYFTCYMTGEVRRHKIASLTTPLSGTELVGTWASPAVPGPYIGALQLGPNGKIYGAKVGQTSLFEIAAPDSPMPGPVAFNQIAQQAGGGPLVLKAKCQLGLPTFVRMTKDCEDRCATLSAAVDEQLGSQADGLHNQMAPCRDAAGPAGGEPHAPGGAYGSETPHGPPPCAPLDMPELKPWVSIRWGDSKCDCIEGDDTEIMYLTVCNPYKNLTLSNLTVYELAVVDANGNPVPLLPDKSPSIQLVPIGPYCFDDIAPCSCVTRQFLLRLRGAPGGSYHILLRGICFDACFHGDEEDCFIFQVCKD